MNTTHEMNLTYDKKLESCRTVTKLSMYLERIGCHTPEEQLEFLDDYMCVLYTCKTDGVTSEQECEIVKRTFVEGKWRKLTNKYDLIKLEKKIKKITGKG
ncbi:MAG: hypothetical protein FWH10_07205 [Oscillospiraceae bacterium]|nr:hypothetical protein [Oscillospiraceae bacterium]